MHEKNALMRERELEGLFLRIFRDNEYKLYTLALRLTKSDLYAKDIIQEVFLSLWNHRSTIREINNIEAWLYRVTENKILDFLRNAAVNARLKRTLRENLQHIHTNDTMLLVEAKNCESIINKAVDSLSPQRQLIYRLNREKGLSYKEIADELHLSRHTVKNQLFTALTCIRKLLSNNISLLLFCHLFLQLIGTSQCSFVIIMELFTL